MKRALACLLVCCAAAAAQRKPLLLWKAESGKNTAYLFGSIHMGSQSMYPLPKPVEDAFAASSTLIVEVDTKDEPALAASVMSQGMYSGGDDLWKHVSPATRKAVEAHCEKTGFPAAIATRMKPWMLAMTFAVMPFLKSGMNPNLGIDAHFLQQARSGQTGTPAKTVKALETAEWQIRLFSSLPDAVQEKLLASAVNPDADLVAQAKELTAIWASGDAARIDEAVTRHSRGTPPEAGRKLREDRNPNMAAAIETCLKTGGKCFMVVGAAHLVGKEGVVSLLEKRGVRVEQQFADPASPSPAAQSPR